MQKLEKYKDELYLFYKKVGRMPSYQEATKLFKLKSKDSAFNAIQKLIAIGAVKKDSKGKLIPTSRSNSSLKLLGLVEAGFPTPAEEQNLDQITLDEWLINDRNASFMLKVKGDSMIDAGIHQGDYVIVERTNSASIGKIIIAEVDGQWTIKYLRKDSQGYYLEPANKKYKNIRPEEDLSISAVVKAIIRKYD
ncbi:MAG: LexA family transcriptional regulator [Candidatus Paceibacterota bacterium]